MARKANNLEARIRESGVKDFYPDYYKNKPDMEVLASLITYRVKDLRLRPRDFISNSP